MSLSQERADYLRGYSKGLRQAALMLLGGRCEAKGCPVDDYDMLEIHHRYQDGKDHRAEYGSGPQYHRSVIRDLASGRRRRYRLLCANHHRKTTWKERKPA